MDNKTFIVNLFGAPGAGKSTLAALTFSHLKIKGFNVELVTEYAKDLTYSNRREELTIQPYIFGKQLSRIERLINKVDIIVTDSPLLLSIIYTNDRWPASFISSCIDIFMQYNNINYLINRTKEYKTSGRSQTEQESDEIHKLIVNELLDNGIHFRNLTSEAESAKKIVDDLTMLYEGV